MTLTKLCAGDEQRLRAIAAHEAGHATVAGHYKLNPESFIGGPRSGLTGHDAGTAFQNSAVLWGAVLSEDILGYRFPARTLPSVALTPETFHKWKHEMLFGGGLEQLAEYSAPDVLGIRSWHPDLARTCEAAFEILTNWRPWLEWRFEKLLEESRLTFRRAERRGSFSADEAALAAEASFLAAFNKRHRTQNTELSK